IALLSRYLPKSKRFENLLVLVPASEEVHGSGAPQTRAVNKGAIGVSETPLHPTGKARFKNELIDVTTDGEFLDAGTKIEVIETSSNRIVVRRAER
ncbi:MAG: serine peptidase, partial [Planctomycetota bacterium]|nr:serine peptidase [Planctomycetota bacterium]